MSETFVQLELFPSIESPKKTISSEISANSLVLIRYSARLKRRIRCSANGIFGRPELVLPEYMKSDDFVASRELAAAWAECALRRKTAKNKERIKDILNRFWQSVDQVLAERGEKTLYVSGRLPPILPKGEFHDLSQVFAAVNETYFAGKLQCKITWSNRLGGQSFHSLRTDPFTGESFHLISISRGYDFKNCPFYAIAGVVYHECLHIAIPPRMVTKRRVVHGRVFRQHEKLYLYYDEWKKWHEEVLPLNVQSLLKKKRRK
jgi:hypothetical protein